MRVLTELELNKLYGLLSILKFNTERRNKVEALLRDFLLEPKKEIKLDSQNNMERSSELTDKNFVEHMFKDQQHLLSTAASFDDIYYYIKNRYFPYKNIFAKHYKINFDHVSCIPFMIVSLMIKKARGIDFNGEVYAYETKEDCYNPEFLAKPDNEYTKKWSTIITFHRDELKEVTKFSPSFDLDKAMSFFSFTIDDINKNKALRFQEFPILKNDNQYIILAPDYLLNNVPQKMEIVFKQCKEYNYKKGKVFEELALTNLDLVSNSQLIKNILYGGYELDGLLKTGEYSWFIECTSHPPNIKSLKGEIKSIKTDIKKSIIKCVNQAKRAIDHLEHPNIREHITNKNQIGILVILEGVYPNVSYLNLFQEGIDLDCKHRLWLVNFFDLRVILRQKETDFFKDFLIWRTQDNMPIFCLDERDYWAYYFDNYHKNNEGKRNFKLLKQKNNRMIYTSQRFTDKRYLAKVYGNQQNS